MRALFDANIFISYLLPSTTQGTIAAIVEAAVEGAFTLILPHELVDRFPAAVESKPYLAKRITRDDAESLLTLLLEVAEVVPAIGGPIPSFSRHVKDDYLVAYALLGQADYLVTGDDDLLVLREIEGVKIVTAGEFCQVIKKMES